MRPVLVDDSKYPDPQHLRPSEAEALMGWDHGCTAAPSVTDKQRLEIIGKGWDLNSVHAIIRFSRLSNCNPLRVSQPLSPVLDPHDAVLQCLLTQLRSDGGDAAVAQMRSTLDMPNQVWCLHLMNLSRNNGYSVLDSGSSKHLSNQTQILDPHDRKSLTGFNGTSTITTPPDSI